jgi:hypothetical protein
MKHQGHIEIEWKASDRKFLAGSALISDGDIDFDEVYRHWFNGTAEFLPSAEKHMYALVGRFGERRLRDIAGV